MACTSFSPIVVSVALPTPAPSAASVSYLLPAARLLPSGAALHLKPEAPSPSSPTHWRLLPWGPALGGLRPLNPCSPPGVLSSWDDPKFPPPAPPQMPLPPPDLCISTLCTSSKRQARQTPHAAAKHSSPLPTLALLPRPSGLTHPSTGPHTTYSPRHRPPLCPRASPHIHSAGPSTPPAVPTGVLLPDSTPPHILPWADTNRAPLRP